MQNIYPPDPPESLSLDEETLRIIITELHLIRTGIWYLSILPFTTIYLGIATWLTLAGVIPPTLAIAMLFLAAFFHYSPQYAPALINLISELVPNMLRGKKE